MYQRIRDLREDEGYTQKKVAEMLYDSQQHYQLYESGKREPPFEVIIRLAKIYGVSIDYIAGLTNDKGGLHKNNKEEQEVLTLYHNLSSKNKQRIIGRMQEITERNSEKSETNKSVTIKQGNNNKNNINIK